MMMNLFSLFDPLIFNSPMNLILSSMILLSIAMKKKNINNSMMNLFTNLFLKMIMNMNFKNNKSTVILLSSIMLMMLIYNLSNILPMIMSNTSNIMLNINMTMLMWLINMIIMFKKHNILFMNFTPSNSPISIMMIINLIELNSLFFQIISLTMRLTINMMLGHMIIALLNNQILIYMYMLVEMFIILIQTYIFLMLNLLNFNNNL